MSVSSATEELPVGGEHWAGRDQQPDRRAVGAAQGEFVPVRLPSGTTGKLMFYDLSGRGVEQVPQGRAGPDRSPEQLRAAGVGDRDRAARIDRDQGLRGGLDGHTQLQILCAGRRWCGSGISCFGEHRRHTGDGPGVPQGGVRHLPALSTPARELPQLLTGQRPPHPLHLLRELRPIPDVATHQLLGCDLQRRAGGQAHHACGVELQQGDGCGLDDLPQSLFSRGCGDLSAVVRHDRPHTSACSGQRGSAARRQMPSQQQARRRPRHRQQAPGSRT